MKKIPDIKLYIQFIIHQKQYTYLKECDKYVENLEVLSKNRLKVDIIFISSNPFNISYAIRNGYYTIPIIQYENFIKNDFQLCLLENYILIIRHLKDMRKRMKTDFLFLT